MALSSKREHRWRKVVAVTVGVGALTLATVACGTSNAPTSDTGSGSAFVVNWGTSITSLDPAFTCPGDDNSFASNFYGTLVTLSTTTDSQGFQVFNPDPAKVQPGLATSWKVSNDGKTYTFTLRPGEKFANGDPLDAAAVKYSIDRTLTMNACGALSLQLGITSPPLITGVSAPNATTVVVDLARAYPAILYGLAQSRGSIYDPKVVDANGGVQKGQPNQYLTSHTASSSGPYVLSQYVPNNYALLTANPNYYGTKPIESKIRVNFVQSVPTLLLQAQNGQADVTLGLPAQSVKTLSTNSCCTVTSDPSTSPVTVSMNYNGPTTNNVDFRTALTYAIPYQQILEKVAYGYGDLYYGPVVPGMAGYPAGLEPPRTYDVAKAKQLIASSGLHSPSLTLTINSTSSPSAQIATILQAAWQAIGVKVNIDSRAPADFSTVFNNGTYQAALNFENSTPIGGYELRKKMTCGSSFNNQHICIPGTQDLLTQLNDTADPTVQQPLVNQLVEAWRAQSPTIILYRARFTAVLKPGVKHFLYAPAFNFAGWGQ